MEGCNEISRVAEKVRRLARRRIADAGQMKEDRLTKTLLGLELELLSPQVRASDVRLDALLAQEMVEFGSSGRIYHKHSIISLLTQAASSDTFEIDNFRLVTSGEHGALATYTCEARSDTGDVPRRSNRSSLWIRREGRWQMIFHQGTKTE